ncbi:putative RNA methyltransferase [Alsobacter metallidurans]|uniref:RNA methyltransferase n=1 Tax=Alsobacter metallidurans TaxID=340221 RepID=A0A917I5Y0_9HYPH|nr:methyltransferase [Alsobacter metallidurans]GGH15790.1 putative RNA methyltransferase [Alsobacter metallidurans]
MAERLVIERLGQRGDGVALTDRGPVYVPYALPGETVLAEVAGDRGRLIDLELAAPSRVEAPCPLFGTCGGCAAQHMGAADYLAWKSGQIAATLRQAGVETDILPMVPAHGAGRRRVVFHARRVESEGRSRMAVGFMAARSHDLVPIPFCPLLVPELGRAPEVALALAEACSKSAKPLDIQVTATLGGLDVDLRGHGPASPRLRTDLVQLAERLGLARLTMHGDLIVALRPAAIQIGRAQVEPPPGGFLQATAAGEEALSRLVLEAMPRAKKVADLFAGVGPFALRIAERAAVHAVEGEAFALQALQAAVRRTQGLRPLTVETRDLFRRPLMPLELKGYDAVVFDPPRAGAEAQARQLAESGVPTVVGVSCSPSTFARDAAILVGGGYTLTRVTPVDQFLYSAHVELVGVFERPRASRARPTLG